MGKYDNVRNINVIIGNGFDISILESIDNRLTTTTFEDFYNYYISRFKVNNKIIKKMKEDKELCKKQWSDIEYSLIDLYKECKTENDVNKLINDRNDLQVTFVDFLNERISLETLKNISEKSNYEGKNKHTFYSFSSDINEDDKLKFNDVVDHNLRMEWSVFNLNYTYIADNYLSVDLTCDNLHEWVGSYNNLGYQPPLSKHKGATQTEYQVKFDMSIFHPHGSVSIPSSLLLGVNDINQLNDVKINENDLYRDIHRKEQEISKEFLAQDDEKYKSIIDKGMLFILFGVSLGETDKWWWKQIINRMSEEFDLGDKGLYIPELIIYNYVDKDILNDSDSLKLEEEEVKNKFLSFCEDAKLIDKIKNNIFIVSFSDATKLNAFSSFK